MCGHCHGHMVMTFLLVLSKEMGKPENSAKNETILVSLGGYIHKLPLLNLTKLTRLYVGKK